MRSWSKLPWQSACWPGCQAHCCHPMQLPLLPAAPRWLLLLAACLACGGTCGGCGWCWLVMTGTVARME